MANPVKEWVERCAQECGSPEELLRVADTMKSEHIRYLLKTHAEWWLAKERRNAQ